MILDVKVNITVPISYHIIPYVFFVPPKRKSTSRRQQAGGLGAFMTEERTAWHRHSKSAGRRVVAITQAAGSHAVMQSCSHATGG